MSLDLTNQAQHARDMLDPTSNAWKDHEDTVSGDKNWRFQYSAPRVLKCESTPEYQRIQSEYLAAQNRANRCGAVLKELIYHQEGLRSAASEDNLISRELSDRATFLAAANDLHKHIAKVKFEQDQCRQKQRDAEKKLRSMEQAELDAHRAANPELYMGHYLEKSA